MKYSDAQLDRLDALSRLTIVRALWGRYLRLRERNRQRAVRRDLGRQQMVQFNSNRLELDFTSLHDVKVYRSITATGAWEPETTKMIHKHLREGDGFVDVGANNGYYSVVAGSLVGASGRVLAIEPNPNAFQRLQRNVVLNGFADRTKLYRAAAGDRAGVSTIYVNEDDDGLSSMIDRSGRPIQVQTLALDDIVPDCRRLFVKIDVEGGELSVLRGMARVLTSKTPTTVIVEWNRKYATAELRRYLFSTFRVNRIVMGGGDVHLRTTQEEALSRGIVLCNLWCERIN